MFMLQDMVIDALVIAAIMVCAFIFVYILKAIVGEWRSHRRACSTQRRSLAARQAWDHAGTPR
ncbi:MAG: hypothetical protein NTW58_03860 [Actinobacteria bacterium]|nr:hypothetical protein [Actinomycetota bacterium]